MADSFRASYRDLASARLGEDAPAAEGGLVEGSRCGRLATVVMSMDLRARRIQVRMSDVPDAAHLACMNRSAASCLGGGDHAAPRHDLSSLKPPCPLARSVAPSQGFLPVEAKPRAHAQRHPAVVESGDRGKLDGQLNEGERPLAQRQARTAGSTAASDPGRPNQRPRPVNSTLRAWC